MRPHPCILTHATDPGKLVIFAVQMTDYVVRVEGLGAKVRDAR